MSLVLPEIIAFGLFDSRHCFPGMIETTPRHVTVYEVEQPIETGGIAWLDGVPHPIRKGMILFAQPGQERRSTLHFKCRYLKFQSQDPAIQELLETIPEFFETSREEEYASILDAMREIGEEDSIQWEVRMGARILDLIYLLHKDAGRFVRQQTLLPGRINDRKLRFILEYIDANFRYQLSLESLAAQVSYSPIYFHKLFCAAMGKTPRKYILERRIRAAREMLEMGNIPLSNIAMECGFSSQSYFNYIFKKETGMTPSAYIRENNDRYRGKDEEKNDGEA